jgi:uncharacterized protein YjeT (DUF2065 family)
MDLRLIIGRLLLAIGLLLIMAAKLAPASIRTELYGTNLNLAWGVVLVASGLLFSFASRKAK